jgi:hypothetical protein
MTRWALVVTSVCFVAAGACGEGCGGAGDDGDAGRLGPPEDVSAVRPADAAAPADAQPGDGAAPDLPRQPDAPTDARSPDGPDRAGPPVDVPGRDVPRADAADAGRACRGDSSCDDGDPCTTDRCDEGTCRHDPALDCREVWCDNEYDDDHDGQLDCADDDCVDELTCTVGETDCTNGLDDDGDLLVDCWDSSCREKSPCTRCTALTRVGCGADFTASVAAGGPSSAAVYTCAGPRQVFEGPELVYELTAPGVLGVELVAKPWYAPDGSELVRALAATGPECRSDRCVDLARWGAPLLVAAQTGEVWNLIVELSEAAQGVPLGLTVRCLERPYCGDGFDNDGDGAVDCEDDDCAGAARCFCRDARPVGVAPVRLAGEDTAGLPSRRAAYACGSLGGPAYPGPELVYAYTSPLDATVRFTLFTPVYRHIFLLGAACDPESPAACLAATEGAGVVELLHRASRGATYYLVVDGAGPDADGPFDIEVVSQAAEHCDNGFDDDLDGWTDCFDADCRAPEVPPSAWDEACRAEKRCDDGEDNDADRHVDCRDPDCTGRAGGPAGEPCEAPERSCADGFDNDGDGPTDCVDPDCAELMGPGGVPCEYPERSCADGFDNDGDGSKDCGDGDCEGRPGPGGTPCPMTEHACADAVDDDADGQTDCADEDCAGDPRCFCGASIPVACGAILSADLTGQQSAVDYYVCSDGPADGPEVVYAFTATDDGAVRLAAAVGQEDDVSFAVLHRVCDGSRSEWCLVGTERNVFPPIEDAPQPSVPATVFDARAGQTYHVVVDTADGVADFTATLTCPRDAVCAPQAEAACGGTVSGNTIAGALTSLCGIPLPETLGVSIFELRTRPSAAVRIDSPGRVAVLAGACDPDACVVRPTWATARPVRFPARSGTPYYLVFLGSVGGGVQGTIECSR